MIDRGPYILTASGVRFHPLDPRPEDIVLDDVARGLSNACRFACQLPRFYSVAEHSVLVSRLVPRRLALEALLHDAEEAYPPGDIPTPMKRTVEARLLVDAQARIRAVVRARFGLTPIEDLEVERGDRWAFVIESRTFRDNLPEDYFTTGKRRDAYDAYLALTPPWVPIGHTPEAARRLWLGRYHELGGPLT